MGSARIMKGDALELLADVRGPLDLIATDPPYALGGDGAEHAVSATVAIVLREAARLLADGRWMLIFSASSWRSTAYMVEAVRGILTPVRFGTWTKPAARTRASTPGWKWASVNVIAFRKGRNGDEIEPSDFLDHIEAEPVTRGRRAQLPAAVADWAVRPFAIPGGRMLDPFAGSGALCFAAERAGMDATGLELEPIDEGLLSSTQEHRPGDPSSAPVTQPARQEDHPDAK